MDWYVVLILVILGIGIAAGVVWFLKLPMARKISNLKEWLKYGVAESEKALGSGTGQLKLRMVYDMAISKFPWLSKFISFITFSSWVDEALEWLNKQISENSAAQDYIKH